EPPATAEPSAPAALGLSPAVEMELQASTGPTCRSENRDVPRVEELVMKHLATSRDVASTHRRQLPR
ncbi:hypothetical protein AB0K74_43930, partial [Streptomyces sp. NPDC056159]|uniref:hypothetical protein n=1 Tax=Streptomyces sp. NPDC056159 TaxID=3155537 RepID=UPI00343820A5